MVQCATPWDDQSCCPEDLAAAFIWQGTWITGRIYPVNAAVEHEGSTWVCVKAHASLARPAVGANEPPDDPAVTDKTDEWELMALGGNTINWRGPYSDIVQYAEFDAVNHLGSAWVNVSETGSLGVEPGTDPLVWELLVEGVAGTSSGYSQRFDADTDTSQNPLSGNFRINAGDTEIASNNNNIDAEDITAWILDFAGGTTPDDLGSITVKETLNPDTNWKRYTLTAVTADTGFIRLTVVLLDESAVGFTAGRISSIEFSRTGDFGLPPDGTVTNAMLADMAAQTVKVRNVASTGVPIDMVVGVNNFIGRGGGDLRALPADSAQAVLDTAANPYAKLGSVQVFLAGQRKQVTDITDWGTGAGFDLDSSNDFDAGTVTGTVTLPTPAGTIAADTAQAGEITLTVSSGNAGFEAGWRFPNGTPPDLFADGDYTLYYRAWNDGSTTHYRITGLDQWLAA